ASDPSTPTIREARDASGSEAAPAPTPTSRTLPPSGGSASSARRWEGDSGARSAAAVRPRNTAGSGPRQGSGAVARIASGIARARKPSAHRLPAFIVELARVRMTAAGFPQSCIFYQRLSDPARLALAAPISGVGD